MKIHGCQYRKVLCLIFSQFFLASLSNAEEQQAPQIVRVMAGEPSYLFKLVETSLSAAGVGEQYQLVSQQRGDVSYTRLTKLLANLKHVDIAGLGVTHNRMRTLRAIQQPLLFGLHGYRILLVHKNDLAMFQGINSISQLQRLQAGSVYGWADNQILLDNNLPTHIATNSLNVYSMLSRKRIDYFPRSLQEVTKNFNEHVLNHPELAIEQHLALYYQLPVYFFLSKQNETLAAHLEYGLTKLVESGELRRIFLKFYTTKIAELNIEKRTVLLLENKTLPPNIEVSPGTQWLAH